MCNLAVMAGDYEERLRLLWSDERLFAPLFVTGLASFGGALHEPVTVFYYVLLGATPSDVGNLNTVAVLGTLLLAPALGWSLDRGQVAHCRGALTATASLCTGGCLLRGVAGSLPTLYVAAFMLGLGSSLWSLALATLSMATERASRPAIISGFIGLQRIAALTGKGLYPALFWLVADFMGVQGELMQYRLIMLFCTLFCLFGSAYLLSYEYRMPVSHLNTTDDKRNPATVDEEQDVMVQSGSDTSANVHIQDEEDHNPFGFAAAALGVVAQGSFSATLSILWPLYLKHQFQWNSSDYSTVLFIVSVAVVIGVMLHPIAEARVGDLPCAAFALSFAAFATELAFTQNNPILHTALIILMGGLLGVAEPCLKSLATQQLPGALQGRAWGVITSLSSVGTMFGSSIGGLLFKQKPILPFQCVSALALVATGILLFSHVNLPMISGTRLGYNRIVGKPDFSPVTANAKVPYRQDHAEAESGHEHKEQQQEQQIKFTNTCHAHFTVPHMRSTFDSTAI